jgi:hypothetical protein
VGGQRLSYAGAGGRRRNAEEGAVNETIILLLLTALRIALPVLVLMGIGTLVDAGCRREGEEVP